MKKFYLLLLITSPFFLFSNDLRHVFSSRPIQIEKIEMINEIRKNEALNGSYESKTPIVDPIHHHEVLSIQANGTAIEIDDGSLWRIMPEQNITSKKWMLDRKDKVTVVITQNTNWFFYKDYTYKLINTKTNETVYANMYLGPIVDSEFTHTIIDINQKKGELVLENNSTWKVSSSDMKIFEDWALYDAIVVGVNSSWLSRKKMLLINVNMNNYVRADQK